MYGSGGYDEMPRGSLLLEVFRTHAHVHDFKVNRLPKVIFVYSYTSVAFSCCGDWL